MTFLQHSRTQLFTLISQKYFRGFFLHNELHRLVQSYTVKVICSCFMCLESTSFFCHLIYHSPGFLVSFSLSVKSKPESEHLLWASLKGADYFRQEEIGPALSGNKKTLIRSYPRDTYQYDFADLLCVPLSGCFFWH